MAIFQSWAFLLLRDTRVTKKNSHQTADLSITCVQKLKMELERSALWSVHHLLEL